MPQQHPTSTQKYLHPSRALLVYQYDFICPRNRFLHGHGGMPRRPFIDIGRTIEVSHAYARDMKEKLHFFMYRAVGSGLFYRANRTLVCSDARDLANFLNLTAHTYEEARKYGVGGWVVMALKKASAILMAQHGIDTVMLTNHVDSNEFNYSVKGHRCLDYFKTEVIHLGATIHFSCPRSANMAWGWGGRRTQCSCAPNARRDEAFFSAHDDLREGAGQFWPFESIQCDVNGANASKYRTQHVVNVTARSYAGKPYNPFRGAALGIHTAGDEAQGAWLAECMHACHYGTHNPTCVACVSMLPER